MSTVVKALLLKLKREPVAFYGGLVSALLVVLGVLGVSADTIALVGSVATLLGIPVVRPQVIPAAKATAAVEAAGSTLHIKISGADPEALKAAVAAGVKGRLSNSS